MKRAARRAAKQDNQRGRFGGLVALRAYSCPPRKAMITITSTTR